MEGWEMMEFSGNGTRGRKTMVDRPNVVVIVADTFRRDHLGVYGNPRIRTPHLDEFARSAVVFDHHVVSSFPTMPARADILTGTFSYTHMGWEPLPRHLQTLPELLSRAGYLTMGVVDTPFFIRNGFGYDRGFDDFVWVRGQGDDTRPHERADARRMWRSEEDRIVARTMTEAERWLERHYDERFFLYVDTWDPHEPWDRSEERRVGKECRSLCDWSSDVCSSDLDRGAHDDGGRAVAGAALRRAFLPVCGHLGPARALGRSGLLHRRLQGRLCGRADLPLLRKVGRGRLEQGRCGSRPRHLLRRGDDGGLLDRASSGEAGRSGPAGEHAGLLHLRPRLLLRGARLFRQGRVGART